MIFVVVVVQLEEKCNQVKGGVGVAVEKEIKEKRIA